MTLDDARQAGEWARDAGKPIGDCPMYGPGEDGYQKRKAWREGWVRRDRQKAQEALR